MAFSNDGTKMFVVGDVGNDVNEYTLPTPFDLSTATFADVVFSVFEQDRQPTGMAFSNDGAKMFIVGWSEDAVNEYTLSSVYPIRVTDGTLPTFVSSELNLSTGTLRITFSETIDATPKTNVDAAKIHIRESGIYTGGVTMTASEIGTAADASTISFTLTEQHLAAARGLTVPELTIEPGAVQDTFGNLIAGTFDVSTATHIDSFSVLTREAFPTGMAFSNDGAKMFVAGVGGNINEYTLSTPFSVSTAAHAHSFNVTAQDGRPSGVAFSNDGAKMFVVGSVGDSIYEYALPTPFELSTASFANVTFPVLAQNQHPEDMAFSNDGAKMFMVGDDGDSIYEYALPTPFELSTASFANVTFSVFSQDPAPRGMAFSNDGAKMFVIGPTAGIAAIHEYTLPTPFDLSTASYANVAFPVSLQEMAPQGMAFSNDGAKMFIVGQSGNAVNEYTLSSVYPVTVPERIPPTFVSSGLDLSTGALRIAFSETIDATPKTNVDAARIHIRELGNYTGGGITLTAGELGTATDASTISFTLTKPHLATVKGLTTPELTIEPGAVQDTFGNLIVGTFDVSTATYDDNREKFPVSQDGSPTGMAFSNDGAKMFVVGSAGEAIYEYTLTAPFDLSTATYDGDGEKFLVSSPSILPTGMAFSNDGTKIFVVGDVADNVHEYTLSPPFDVSTARFVYSLHVFAQETEPQGVAFSNDGTKMFVVGSAGQDINEYTLTTPFSVSTATSANVTFPVSDQDTSPKGMAFSNDGTKMFVVGSAGDSIYEYTLTAPFDLSTASYDGIDEKFSVTIQEIVPQGMAFSNDGAKMFVVGSHGDDINEYTLSSVYPIGVTDGTIPTFVSSGLDLSTGTLSMTFSETIDATPKTNVIAAMIHIRESGTYTGGVTPDCRRAWHRSRCQHHILYPD